MHDSIFYPSGMLVLRRALNAFSSEGSQTIVFTAGTQIFVPVQRSRGFVSGLHLGEKFYCNLSDLSQATDNGAEIPRGSRGYFTPLQDQ